jgi:hypothetical protein
MPKYKENKAGWPQVVKDLSSSGSKNDPMDWSDLFGFKEGISTRILVSEVPDLRDALKEISRMSAGDEDLMRGLSFLATKVPPEEMRDQIEFETVRFLIGSILNRAAATSAESDDQLKNIYRQREQALFAKELIGDVVIPLITISFDIDNPVHIDGDIYIERLTESDHRLQALPWFQQGSVSPYVASAATHAVVQREVQFTNKVHDFTISRELPSEISTDVAKRIAEAVYIVTEMTTGHAQVLVRPHGWADKWIHDLPPLWSAWSGRAYPEKLNNRTWDEEMHLISLSEAIEVAQITRTLTCAPKNVRIAARRSRQVTFRDDPEDMVLDAAIGIEALVGREADALTHRMAQRAAIALADEIPPENTYRMLKAFYSIRSKIAHGEAPKRWTIQLGEQNWDTIQMGVFFLRKLLRNRLLADQPWDATSLDDRMLEKFERASGYPTAEKDHE